MSGYGCSTEQNLHYLEGKLVDLFRDSPEKVAEMTTLFRDVEWSIPGGKSLTWLFRGVEDRLERGT
jgi:hypothetical protein